jgi:membrane protein YqaA with SNARE-associated domain
MEAAAYVSLFVSAFAAATILPLSSEAVLSALIAAEGFDIWFLVGIASIANTLGAAVNWVLGRYCLRWRDHRWFPVSTSALDQASEWFVRYGQISLLFTWFPIVGDPLTVVAGLLRVSFWRFLLLVAIGKTLRYVAIALLAERVFT